MCTPCTNEDIYIYIIYGGKQTVLLQPIWISKTTFRQPRNHHPSRKGIKSLRHGENGCRCILVLKKEFDTVDHTILLRKLQSVCTLQ